MHVTCPACHLEGELPDDGLSRGTLTCPQCSTQFEQQPGVVLETFPHSPVESITVGGPEPSFAGVRSVSSELSDDMSVWVGVEASPVLTPPPNRKLAPDVVRSPAPPVAITAENAVAHLDWIEQEVDRFNRFVSTQMELIQKTRLDLTRADAKLSAAILIREQELNREKALLSSRASTLDLREAELVESRSQIAARLTELERNEQAMQRKMLDFEEVEETMRAEFEESERELQRQRQAIEEKARELRSRSFSPAPSPGASPELIESLRSILRNFESAPDRIIPAQIPNDHLA